LSCAYRLERKLWRNEMYQRGVAMFILLYWMTRSRFQCPEQRESPGLGPTLEREVIFGCKVGSWYQFVPANHHF
jgi:hypothetical protein